LMWILDYSTGLCRQRVWSSGNVSVLSWWLGAGQSSLIVNDSLQVHLQLTAPGTDRVWKIRVSGRYRLIHPAAVTTLPDTFVFTRIFQRLHLFISLRCCNLIGRVSRTPSCAADTTNIYGTVSHVGGEKTTWQLDRVKPG